MYLWVKALHIISVIAWMAGMLYLPRLYVYHANLARGSEAYELFKIMERRLLRYIINPAMVSAWGFGVWLVTIIGWNNLKAEGWFHVKIMLVALMQVIHALLARARRQFEQGRNHKSARFYRIINESVSLVMIVIVIMAVVKPL